MTFIMIMPQMMNIAIASNILFPLSSPDEVPQSESNQSRNKCYHNHIHLVRVVRNC